jgi:hypothetical protein
VTEPAKPPRYALIPRPEATADVISLAAFGADFVAAAAAIADDLALRLVYRQLDDTTREIVAIRPREEHAIYRLAASRLQP